MKQVRSRSLLRTPLAQIHLHSSFIPRRINWKITTLNYYTKCFSKTFPLLHFHPVVCLLIFLICLTHILLVLVDSCTGGLDKHKNVKTSLKRFNVLFSLISEAAESALCCPKVQLLRLLIMRISAHSCGTKVSTFCCEHTPGTCETTRTLCSILFRWVSGPCIQTQPGLLDNSYAGKWKLSVAIYLHSAEEAIAGPAFSGIAT